MVEILEEAMVDSNLLSIINHWKGCNSKVFLDKNYLAKSLD